MKCTKYLHKIFAHKLEVRIMKRSGAVKQFFHKDENKGEVAIRTGVRDLRLTLS